MSLHVLSLVTLPFSPTCILVVVNEAQSYFASSVILYQ
jgi:hypothetical protein